MQNRGPPKHDPVDASRHGSFGLGWRADLASNSQAAFAARRVGAIVSGDNIDSRLLAGVMMRGLVRVGRLVRLRVEISDQPGALSVLTGRIGELGANIVEVEHDRWFNDMPARRTGVELTLELRAPEDAARIVSGLREAGLGVEELGLRRAQSETAP